MREPRLLKVRESADALSCSVPMVRKLIKAGSLPAVRVGRAVRVPVAAVEALVAADGAVVGSGDAPSDDLQAMVQREVDRQITKMFAAPRAALDQLAQEVRELRHEVYPETPVTAQAPQWGAAYEIGYPQSPHNQEEVG